MVYEHVLKEKGHQNIEKEVLAIFQKTNSKSLKSNSSFMDIMSL
jgi:hypothetical protein